MKKKEKGLIALLRDVLWYVSDIRMPNEYRDWDDVLTFWEEIEGFFVWRAQKRVNEKYGFYHCSVCGSHKISVDRIDQSHTCASCNAWALDILRSSHSDKLSLLEWCPGVDLRGNCDACEGFYTPSECFNPIRRG